MTFFPPSIVQSKPNGSFTLVQDLAVGDPASA